MHRTGFIFEKIVDMENLKHAVYFATKNKKKRKSVQRFLADQDNKLKILQQRLIDGTFRCMPYSTKIIQDKGSGKEREIFIPKFYPDQIVQWALMLQLKPILFKGMYDYSCASIEGRGQILGIRKLKKILTRDEHNTKYCFQCDIRKFYPNIDQDVLYIKFTKKIKDERTLNLIKTIINSVPKGAPIGNYTSQWFANFFLQDLDHYIKEDLHIKYYIRYMDDLVMFGANKRTLHLARQKIEQFLQNERLKLKDNWQIFKIASLGENGRFIDFLGYKFYRNYTGLRGRTFVRAVARIKKVSKKDYLTAKDSQAIISYLARFDITSTNGLYIKKLNPFICIKNCKLSISKHDKLNNLSEKVLVMPKFDDDCNLLVA